MRQTHSRSPFLRSDVRAAWRELLQRETDAARAIDLHRRERDLFPRFTEHIIDYTPCRGGGGVRSEAA